MRALTILFFSLLLFSACPKVSKSPNYNLGETIQVKMNQPVMISSEDISILLTEVQEGRCPKNTNCIQAGKAKVMIDFGVKDAVSTINLEAKGFCYKEDGSCGNSATAQGYNIKLYSLNPYPSEGNNGTRDYTAKIMVTK